MQVALNTLGTDAVAAHTTASRVDSIAVALLSSLGLAVSMYAAQNVGGRRPDRIRKGVMQAMWIAVAASIVIGALLITFSVPMVRLFIGEGSDEVVDLAHLMLVINGFSYWALGLVFVVRGALQGLGHTLIPTVTGIVELTMRVAAADILGVAFGFVGVALSNPMAWIGAVVVLVPAYLVAHRKLADMKVDPVEMTLTTPIPVIGPTDSSLVVDGIVTQPVVVIRQRRFRRSR
mgnify:CR=1 FL=1